MDIDSKDFYIQLFTDALMCQDIDQIFAFERNNFKFKQEKIQTFKRSCCIIEARFWQNNSQENLAEIKSCNCNKLF